MEEDIFTWRDKVASCQTLACLFYGLPNSYTVVELRNEFVVVGTISQVDSKTNLIISNAVVHNLKGACTSYDKVFIPGKQIRYVHIHEELDSMGVVRKMCNSIVNHSQKKRRLWRSRQQQHLENKAIARAYKLGRGRLKAADGGVDEGALPWSVLRRALETVLHGEDKHKRV